MCYSLTGGRVFVFIYTHADEETGTLYFGANLAAQTLRNVSRDFYADRYPLTLPTYSGSMYFFRKVLEASCGCTVPPSSRCAAARCLLQRLHTRN